MLLITKWPWLLLLGKLMEGAGGGGGVTSTILYIHIELESYSFARMVNTVLLP